MSIDPSPSDDLAELPPPRPTTPPLRRGFVWVLMLLCLLTAVVYGVPYMLDQIGYAYETGRARAATRGAGEARRGRGACQGVGAVSPRDSLGLAGSGAHPDAVVLQGWRGDVPGLGRGDRPGQRVRRHQRARHQGGRPDHDPGRENRNARRPRRLGPEDRPGGPEGQGVGPPRGDLGRLGQARSRRLGPGDRQPLRPGTDRKRGDRLGHLEEQPGYRRSRIPIRTSSRPTWRSTRETRAAP